jgi:hypothetical protein
MRLLEDEERRLGPLDLVAHNLDPDLGPEDAEALVVVAEPEATRELATRLGASPALLLQHAANLGQISRSAAESLEEKLVGQETRQPGVDAAPGRGGTKSLVETTAPDRDRGLLALRGGDDAWIWAHTCPEPECTCRTALILATREGRSALLEIGEPVHAAWRDGSGYADVASKLRGVDAFGLGIDTVVPCKMTDGEPLDLELHPRVRAIVERLDGEVLDRIGRLWYAGKGKPDPEARVRQEERVALRGWEPGKMVGWDDLLGVRRDLYDVGQRLYLVTECYCVDPACDCREVVLHMDTRIPRGGPCPGHVRVSLSGAATLEPTKRQAERLEQLWAAFQARHPDHLARFAAHYAVMKDLGNRIVPAPRPSTKIPRNAPCPCGSGRKYKKCCGAA